jgi:hypothetical protein
VGNLDPSRGEFVLEGMQRQMRYLADPFLDEGAMRLKHGLTVAAHLAGRYRARRPIALRPLHH